MATYDEIEKALVDMKSAVSAGHVHVEVEREKNINFLLDIGWTSRDVKNEILTLSHSDYFQGPVPDYDRPGTDDFWIFKRVIEGILVYIKFKIEYDDDGKVNVVSFHDDQP